MGWGDSVIELPAMLYRPGTAIVWEGMKLDTLIVNSPDEYDAAITDEWVTAATLTGPLPDELPAERVKRSRAA